LPGRDASEQERAGEPSSEKLLVELADYLAVLATRAMYEEQPRLWQLGEHARARTLEDFKHHFRALATMDDVLFTSHVQYCIGLFRERGFAQQWLSDGWRLMAEVMGRELPPKAAEEAIRTLRHGVAGGGGGAPAAQAVDPATDC
jgi:hypothetical protein